MAGVVTLETIEAKARRLMFDHSNIEPRGWTTIAARHALHRQIDVQLDAWNAATTLLAHEFDAAS